MSVLAPVLPLFGGLGWVSPPLLAHLGDQQGAHARARASTQGMAQLEALQAVAALGLLSSESRFPELTRFEVLEKTWILKNRKIAPKLWGGLPFLALRVQKF